jgi:hypothetical protein
VYVCGNVVNDHYLKVLRLEELSIKAFIIVLLLLSPSLIKDSYLLAIVGIPFEHQQSKYCPYG